jgi:hypothetical protein
MAANASKYGNYSVCCKACSEGNLYEHGCTPGNDCTTGYVNRTLLCPDSIPAPTHGFNTSDQTYRYTCIDRNSFFSDIANIYCIGPDWVEFGNLPVEIDAGCEGSSTPCNNTYDYGFLVIEASLQCAKPQRPAQQRVDQSNIQ